MMVLVEAVLWGWGGSVWGMPPGEGWRLTYADEFDGTALDPSNWAPHDPWGYARNNELQAYVSEALVVGAGALHVTAAPGRAYYDRAWRDYTSGMMNTAGTFSQAYGWFEIRCRVPAGKGLWPAFWLLPLPLAWPPEIDVLEVLGQEPDKVYLTHHWADASGRHQAYGGSFKGPDFSAGMHVFAVDWEPDGITWYVDGVERFRAATNIPTGPMYMLLNLAVGGDWPGPPSAATRFPARFDVDYVRVYQRVAQPAAQS